MKSRLRRLEKLAEEEMVLIPLLDGTVAKFPQQALGEAFDRSLARLKGEDVPEHPLSTACASSSDRHWRNCFVAGTHSVVGGEVPGDLSEP
jgi:hypothetical protein